MTSRVEIQNTYLKQMKYAENKLNRNLNKILGYINQNTPSTPSYADPSVSLIHLVDIFYLQECDNKFKITTGDLYNAN